MASSLSALRAQCRDLLGDLTGGAYIFTDVQLDDWINRAINDLSIHFPRYMVYTVGTTLGTHTYDLEVYHKGIASVEYPTGEMIKVGERVSVEMETHKYLRRETGA